MNEENFLFKNDSIINREVLEEDFTSSLRNGNLKKVKDMCMSYPDSGVTQMHRHNMQAAIESDNIKLIEFLVVNQYMHSIVADPAFEIIHALKKRSYKVLDLYLYGKNMPRINFFDNFQWNSLAETLDSRREKLIEIIDFFRKEKPVYLPEFSEALSKHAPECFSVLKAIELDEILSNKPVSGQKTKI